MNIDFSPLKDGDYESCLVASAAIFQQSKDDPESVFWHILSELKHSKNIRYSSRLLSLLRSMDKEALENSPAIKRHFKDLRASSDSKHDIIKMYSRILDRCGNDGWDESGTAPIENQR